MGKHINENINLREIGAERNEYRRMINLAKFTYLDFLEENIKKMNKGRHVNHIVFVNSILYSNIKFVNEFYEFWKAYHA